MGKIIRNDARNIKDEVLGRAECKVDVVVSLELVNRDKLASSEKSDVIRDCEKKLPAYVLSFNNFLGK